MAERKRPPLYKKGEEITPQKRAAIRWKADPSGAERYVLRKQAGIRSQVRRGYRAAGDSSALDEEKLTRARELHTEKGKQKLHIGAAKDVPKEIRAKAVRKLNRDMNRIRSVVRPEKFYQSDLDFTKVKVLATHHEQGLPIKPSEERKSRKISRIAKLERMWAKGQPLKRTMPKTRALLRGVGKSLGGPAGAAMIGIDAYQQIKQSVGDMNLKSKPKKKKK